MRKLWIDCDEATGREKKVDQITYWVGSSNFCGGGESHMGITIHQIYVGWNVCSFSLEDHGSLSNFLFLWWFFVLRYSK